MDHRTIIYPCAQSLHASAVPAVSTASWEIESMNCASVISRLERPLTECVVNVISTWLYTYISLRHHTAYILPFRMMIESLGSESDTRHESPRFAEIGEFERTGYTRLIIISFPPRDSSEKFGAFCRGKKDQL